MPDFELSGPDGAKYQVTAPDENSALSAFQQLHGAPAPAEPLSTTNLVRSAARGVPIIGGLADKLEAATEASLAPVVEPFMSPSKDSLMPEGGWGSRYAKALELQRQKDAGFDAAHPIASTAAKIGGGIGAFGGAIKAVPALAGPLGFEGTLPQMVAKGAASGAGISAVDALARGEDPVASGEEGAVLGAAGGPVGRVIGKAAGKVMGAFRPSAPLVHAQTTPVAGVEVPVPNTDPVAAAKIEIARRGGAGEPAQRIIQTGDEGVNSALDKAQTNIGGMLDPGAGAARPPQDAAAAVADELRGLETQRFQTEQNVRQRTQAGLEALRSDIAPPVSGAPATAPVASPGAAAEIVGSGVQARAAAARRGYQADYKASAAMPSEFEPGTFRPIGDTVRARLNEGESPVKVDSVNEPNSARMLQDLDTNVGLGNFENVAAPPAGLSANVSRETTSDAELAYRKLTGMGVAPDKARAQVASLPGAEALPSSPLAPHEVAVPGAGAPSRESIGLVAVRDNKTGHITSGRSVHTDLREDIAAKTGLSDENVIFGDQRFTDGFTTKSGRFVTREEAAKIASEADQVKTYPLYEDNAGPYLQHSDLKPETLGAEAVSNFEPHSVALPGGGAVSVAPKVVEASSVRTSADAGYDPSLQPRNRARAASDAQVRDIAANLNPNRLGASAEADRGAPIVGPDGMVESGNGRILAIRQAYADGGPAAARYRAWLSAQGADVSGLKEPVLVRQRTTPMSPEQRRAFTVAANQSSNLSMSASERALTDARSLTPESLAMIRNPADLGAVENRPFVRQFMSKLPQAEQGAMVTASGDLSSEGLARVRNAVIGKAYGNTPTLARIAESTNDDVRSISSALTAAAPEWAAMRAAAKAGHIPANLDVTADLLDAVDRTARIRAKGVSLADAHAQGDAFSKQTPESEAFQRMFYAADGARAAPAGQVSSALRNYAQEAAKVDASPGLDLGLTPVTSKDILDSTAAKVGAPKALAQSVLDSAEAAVSKAAAGGKVIDLNAVDAARKRLVSFYQDAKGHSASDARAARRIMQEFDQFVIDAVDSPSFKGDPAALETLRRARAGVAEYHKQFSAQGRGDEVGPMVEKILGRFPGQQATPDQIAQMSYGSRAEPGGAQAVKVSQRIRQILGPTSPEWGAYKQGLVSHLVDDAPGARPMSAADKADRIDAFLNGTKGRPLAQTVLSAEERAALANHADALRASEPVALKSLGTVDKVIARITGRDGGAPASLNDVTDYFFGANAGKKSLQFQLATRLKRDLSPEGFNALRTGMWSKLTGVTEGKTDLTPKRLSDNLFEFLNGSGSDLSKVLYSPAERTEMLRLAQAVKMHIPVAGSTNPSGTAPMLAKIAGKASHFALPLFGAAHGGIPGAIIGAAADKGITAVTNARAARQAGLLYYGKQPTMASAVPDFAKAAALLSRGAAQGQVGAGH